MANLTVDQLFQVQTKEQILEQMITLAESVGIPARSWDPKGTGRTLFSVTATLLALFCLPILSLIRAGFLETASGAWLTLHAFYFYGVERRPATFAVGNVRINNTSGASYVLQPGDIRLVNSVTQKTYRNTTVVNIAPLQTNITVPILAVEIGSDSSAAPGQINQFETPLAGLVVINLTAIVGAEEESDDELKRTCRAKIESLSPNGARGAYEYFARRTARPDGSIIPVNRVLVSSSSPNATVTTWVATASGVLTGPDLALVEANIFRNSVPNGITPTVSNATPINVPVTYVVYVMADSGITEAELEAIIAVALVDLFETYPIGGRSKGVSTGHLYTELVRSTIAQAHPAIFDAELPGFTDVELDPGEFASLGIINATVNLES